jgi:hypothetical protein
MFSGCAKAPIRTKLPCLDRPILIGIPVEAQQAMGPEAVQIVLDNMIALMEYAAKLENRLECDDTEIL